MIQIEANAILFDLDGVLIDSTVCISRHWQQWAQKHDLNLAEIMRVAHGRRTVETMRLVAPHLPAEEEARHFAAIEAIDTEGVVPIEGAAKLLNQLPVDVWAIVTSGTKDVAASRLQSANLPMPGVFVTADDVRNGKPDPEPYLLAAKALDVLPGKCVVIEDAPAGIEAAHSAGMQAIAITTTHTGRDFEKEQVVVVDCLSQLEIRENKNGYRLVIEIT